MTKLVRYRVAASLDGYIAGPRGEIDWIVHDPTIDFAEVYAGVDTVLLGRRTYELTQQPGAPPWPANWRVYVFSRTLRQADNPNVTVIRDNVSQAIAALRSAAQGDIWLFGGGELCASLLAIDAVDQVELAIMPVLLGGGTPFVAPGAPRSRLKLVQSRTFPSGIVTLRYDIERDVA